MCHTCLSASTELIYYHYFWSLELIHQQEMVEKTTLSQENKKKTTEHLNQENAVEFMSSEKSEEDEQELNKNWSTKKARKATTMGEIKANDR